MNAKALAFGSILAIGGITAWRLIRMTVARSTTSLSGEARGIEAVWAASALSVVISLATDLDAGLGAAFGLAVVVGLLLPATQAAGGSGTASGGLLGSLSGIIARIAGNASKALPAGAPPSSSSGGSGAAPAQPCPSGLRDRNGNCIPVGID